MLRGIYKYWIFSFLLLLFILSISAYYTYFSDIEIPIRKNLTKKDRMDLAMLQEAARTKDPALGYVPRERLYKAYLYAEQLRRGNSNSKAPITGISWVERGPDNQGGRTRSILIDLNDNNHKTIFAGGVSGGLWKTTDITAASPNWASIDDFFDNMAITTIAQDPSTPNTMYFGTGEGWFNIDAVRGDGIWKSTDGGTTWLQLASTTGFHFDNVNKIVVNSSGKIFAATRSQWSNWGGLMMSADGGTSWSRYEADVTNPDWAADVEIAANGDIYASFGVYYSDGIYKSTDGGTSWSNVFSDANAERIELACAPSNANVVYALTQDVATNGIYQIYKTSNAGNTWPTVSLPANWVDNSGICAAGGTEFTRTQAWYNLSAAVDPSNENRVFIGGIDLWLSTDGGSNWSQISNWTGYGCFQYVHADQHAIVFATGDSDTLLFGNDGGVYLTVNGTAATPTITRKDNNYRTVQFYACAIHPTAGNDYFLGGSQDNGSHKFTNPGINSTTEVTGGDGGFCHIDQDEPLYQFTAYVRNRYFRSTDGGTSWSSQIVFNDLGQFINPSDYDNSANILYAGEDQGNYFRWNDPQTGTSSDAVNVTTFGAAKITAVTVSPNTANRVFFGLDDGKVIMVDNANTGTSKTGTDITGGSMPAGSVSVSCIQIENGNDNHLLVTYSNYGVNSVWESIDGGSSWTSIEGNLPDMPIRWILLNPNNNDQALVATEVGVWSTDNLDGATTNWGASNSGLANVRTDMMQIRSSDNIVIAASHGRGLFSMDASALPIELISFTGTPEKDYNLLLWETASELNNFGFEIQRSENGKKFKKIGFVKGNGNSFSNISYQFKDYNSVKELYYYRLKQIDYNGWGVKHTAVITIKKDFDESVDAFIVYPTVFKDVINIYFNGKLSSDFQIELIDISGEKILLEKGNKMSNRYINIMVEKYSLNTGIYLLNIKMGNHNYFTKLMKL